MPLIATIVTTDASLLAVTTDLRERHWSGFHETMRTGRTNYGDGHTLAVRASHKDGKAISVEFSE